MKTKSVQNEGLLFSNLIYALPRKSELGIFLQKNDTNAKKGMVINMDYIGRWVFHSMGVLGDNGMVYLSAEEFINSPMPYVDETDTEAVEQELRDRRGITKAELRICDDGNLYVLLPVPEEILAEAVDEAVAAGELMMIDGMITQKPMHWELRDGEVWYDTQLIGEICGEVTDPWVRALDEDGFFNIADTRYIKAE